MHAPIYPRRIASLFYLFALLLTAAAHSTKHLRRRASLLLSSFKSTSERALVISKYCLLRRQLKLVFITVNILIDKLFSACTFQLLTLVIKILSLPLIFSMCIQKYFLIVSFTA